MDTKHPQQHINVNQLQNIATPTVIKTSKQWVLPPRPRPGRKPNANTAAQPKKEPKKTYKKKNQTQQIQSTSSSPQPMIPTQALQALQMITPAPSTSASSPQTPLTPDSNNNNKAIDESMIQLALKNMEDENQLLKQELSRLVANLKLLKQGQEQEKKPSQLKSHVQDEELYHKKRNVTDDDVSSIFTHIESSEEDDTASQISTPSLVSTSSSMTSSTSSLGSIKEDQVLKIDEFFTTSLFESSSNSISLDTMDSMPMPSLASLKSKIKEEEFEFNFLKRENKEVFKNGASDFLFQGNNEELVDADFWEWK